MFLMSIWPKSRSVQQEHSLSKFIMVLWTEDVDFRYVGAPVIDYRNEWWQCHWCWKWGMSLCDEVLPYGVLPLWDVDGVGYLCDNCGFVLEEPPWYPNARQRCAQSLEHVMPQSLRGNAEVLKIMSAFVVDNEP